MKISVVTHDQILDLADELEAVGKEYAYSDADYSQAEVALRDIAEAIREVFHDAYLERD